MICHMTRLVIRVMKVDQVDNESCNMEKVVRRVLEVANLEVESKLGTIVPTTKKFQLNWTSGSRDNPAGAKHAELDG